MKHRLMGFQLLSDDTGSDSDKMQFSGVANGFHTLDCYGCIMAKGAFKKDLPAFLSDGFIGGINHDWDAPVGRPLSASESSEGLKVSAQLSDTEKGREVHTLLKDGVIKRLSVGFRVVDYTFLELQKEVEEYWDSVRYAPSDEDLKDSKYGAVLMNRVKLFEFSPVTVPGNSLTEISNVRSAPLAGEATMEEQINAALAADAELLERVKSLLGKRSDEGRKLSAAWQIKLRKLHDGYAGLLAQAGNGAVDLQRNQRINQAASQEILARITTNNI